MHELSLMGVPSQTILAKKKNPQNKVLSVLSGGGVGPSGGSLVLVPGERSQQL